MKLQFTVSLSLVLTILIGSRVSAETVVYGFDDGTFQGWQYLTVDNAPFPVDESEAGWAPSNEAIDIGDGFTLLPATSGEYRVVPEPWSTRDCLGGITCFTQILRSPTFELGAGEIAIDMIGGGAQSNRPFDFEVDDPPPDPDWFLEFKDGSGYQGFALLDVAANEYVAHGFSTGENDGKARPTDPETRGQWETVVLSSDTLAPFVDNGKEYAIDIFDSYAGGWGWIGFDTVRIPVLSDSTPGDFNGNGELDAADIDELTVAVLDGKSDAKYDVDGSGAVDEGDRSFWIESLKNSYFGDANLDGEFNSSDFVTVFTAGEYEDGIPKNSTWSEGDWNGDLDFDSSDFVKAFVSGGYEKGPKPAAIVPEPTARMLAMTAVLVLCHRIRRRNSVST